MRNVRIWHWLLFWKIKCSSTVSPLNLPPFTFIRAALDLFVESKSFYIPECLANFACSYIMPNNELDNFI